MSYHMREIVNTCMEGGCTRDARYRVYGPGNASFGDYCRPHAMTKLISLERYEQACDYARHREQQSPFPKEPA